MASIVVAGDTSGTITLSAPAVSGTNTLTLPANTGTVITTASTFGATGPAFSASANAVTSLVNNTYTKVNFQVEDFDTNNNFASSRFTPTVAGYYQVNSVVGIASGTYDSELAIYKNGSAYKYGIYPNRVSSNTAFPCISGLVYCNGSTDYIEIYAYQSSGGSLNTRTNAGEVWFDGFLARAA